MITGDDFVQTRMRRCGSVEHRLGREVAAFHRRV